MGRAVNLINLNVHYSIVHQTKRSTRGLPANLHLQYVKSVHRNTRAGSPLGLKCQSVQAPLHLLVAKPLSVGHFGQVDKLRHPLLPLLVVESRPRRRIRQGRDSTEVGCTYRYCMYCTYSTTIGVPGGEKEKTGKTQAC